ncbi:MAG: hypothetical protein KKD86_17575, partial [Bacteroidetes bacterium]|nr:hypothetical protein [Bacteroidota bacterium]
LYFILFSSTSFVYLMMCFLIPYIKIGNRELLLIAFLSLVIKLLFVSTNPVGSDDYYRYLWDGKVQTNGTNPFQFAPNDSELTHLIGGYFNE